MNDRIKDWLDFFSVCPRRTCNNVLPELWNHLYCNGLLQVNKYAEMRSDRYCRKDKIWKWINCGRHGDYWNPDCFKLMDIFSQLSAIPELRQEKCRAFRKNLKSTIDDECPMY
jgi:hypothetical protein